MPHALPTPLCLLQHGSNPDISEAHSIHKLVNANVNAHLCALSETKTKKHPSSSSSSNMFSCPAATDTIILHLVATHVRSHDTHAALPDEYRPNQTWRIKLCIPTNKNKQVNKKIMRHSSSANNDQINLNKETHKKQSNKETNTQKTINHCITGWRV
jgi:hypothetical protein